MKERIIRTTIARGMIPFIQLFGLYVITHGDTGPGGGFQGGVILAASIILYGVVHSLEDARKIVPLRANDIMNSVGVLLYILVGIACVVAGGNFLEYNSLPFGDQYMASHIGILLIEIGVGITVASVMVTIFFESAQRLLPGVREDEDA